MANRKEVVKTLLEFSTDVTHAERIINVYCNFKTTREKVEFLQDMFDITVDEHEQDEPNEDMYMMILNAIINKKSRR